MLSKFINGWTRRSEPGAAKTIVGAAIVSGYAWITTGVVPFSTLSYVLVAIPCAAFVVVYISLGGMSPARSDISAYYLRDAEKTSLSTMAPWIALLMATIVLEVIGLILGGHSSGVPTLSTTVDHLLARHWERFLLCMVWFFAASVPLLHLWRLNRTRGA